MMRLLPRWAFPVAVLFLLSIGGCSAGRQFVYQPGAPAEAGPKLPVKIAVVAFTDGTENFTQRGSIFDPESLTFNLAKTGISGWSTAMVPELWAKAFADEMSASGTFRSVRFIYSASELLDEDVYIEGTLDKAYAVGGWTRLNEYAISLRALRKTEMTPFWTKKVERAWKSRKDLFDGCGRDMEYSKEKANAETNRIMQGMFAEAGAELGGNLATLLGIKVGANAPKKPEEASLPLSTESVDETIDSILREK